jgi:ABC-type Na+ efflux pump permease subunit
MNARFLWTSTMKDLRRRLRDPWALVLSAGIPFLIGGLLLLVMGGSGPAPPALEVYLADEDGGTLAELLSRAFGGADGFLRLERTTQELGRARLEAGEGTALVVIPRGFASAVVSEEPVELLMVVNPSQSILPQIVREGLELISEAAFYAHRLLGPQIQEIAAGPRAGQAFDNERIARISAAINERVTETQKYLFPPAIRLQANLDAGPRGGQSGMAVLMLPGVLVMSLLFAAQGQSDDLWSERRFGTLKRTVSTPCNLGLLLAGKLLAATLFLALIALLVLAAGLPATGVSLRKLPAAWFWAAATGSFFYLLLATVQLHATSQRAANVLLSSVLMPLMFVGGSFFPSESMPAWMAALGQYTPNGWALERLKDLLLDRASGKALLWGLGASMVIGCALFVVARRRLERHFARA